MRSTHSTQKPNTHGLPQIKNDMVSEAIPEACHQLGFGDKTQSPRKQNCYQNSCVERQRSRPKAAAPA